MHKHKLSTVLILAAMIFTAAVAAAQPATVAAQAISRFGEYRGYSEARYQAEI